MNSYSFRTFVALASCLLACQQARAEILVSDDFRYSQPTKELGPGGGFTRQDYGGGQNGAAGQWGGRWVSSGNAIITGDDFEEEFNQFLGLTAAGLAPVTANFLARDFVTNGLNTEPLYFAVQSRVDIDATTQARFWINAPIGDPLLDEGQISLGYDDFGFTAELGLDVEFNEDEFANDGEDHLLVGKLEVNAAGSSERLTVWLDPSDVEEGPSATVESDVIESYDDLRGTLQLGRLNAGSSIYWDNVAVGTSWDAVVGINVPRLTLRVDPSSGVTSLVNESGEDFAINYYEIASSTGDLDVDGWDSLDDQEAAGWLENNPSGSRITESNFTTESLLSAGQSLSLGRVYKPGTAQNLVARVATTAGLLNVTNVEYVEGEIVQGDFNMNGIIDANDMDLLTTEVRAGTNNPTFDLNNDTLVDDNDRIVWVEDPTIANTYFGDSNLDGEFSSSDLVAVFAAGEYEDGIPDNSVWATGDWDGNGDFDSADFVVAFAAGGYEIGPRNAANAVPEPTACLMLLTAVVGIALRRRHA